MTEITLLYFDGCPSWETTNARLGLLASEYRFQLRRVKVESADDAERSQFRGSPTVLVDGRDAFAAGAEPVGLACRLYRDTRRSNSCVRCWLNACEELSAPCGRKSRVLR
ncbi:MAG TPA: thioredoxin family protein [Acidimicrobiia bacterium]|nr:thioredoxin family protein [Acidimicrobiia bacterium]